MRNPRIAASSSKNAVNSSSAHNETLSIAATQPQLQPALLRLSVALLIVVDRSRRRSTTADSSGGEFARFKSATGRTRCGELCAHFLDLRRLLFQRCREGGHARF